MKWINTSVALLTLTFLLPLPVSAQGKYREKFGADQRHSEVQRELRTIGTSEETIRWKMVMPWARGSHFYQIAQHFADSVGLASGGRLAIKLFSAGELVGAMESFDAVSKGSVEIGHDWPGFWEGKSIDFAAFGSLPFGLDNEGYNIWLYERGGLEQMREVYGRYNLVPFPCGRGGQSLGAFAGSPSAAVVASYVTDPGVHQPSVQCTVFINRQQWNRLPADLKWIVDIAAKETQLWSNTWQERLNMEAAARLSPRELRKARLDEADVSAAARRARQQMDDLKDRSPETRKTLESQERFKRDFAPWREFRSGLAPWPLDDFINGRRLQ